MNKPVSGLIGDRPVDIVFSLPWLDVAGGLFRIARELWRGLADEGMYEVLEYESVLELKDRHGRRAVFKKREKVRYRQNHIIAYQDHAWGDGEILLDYRCSPGRVVDQYRPGRITFLLISLQEAKQRGDVDEFSIQWGIRNGFLRKQELWETEIRHRTRKMRMAVIFPESRPPQQVSLEENIRRKRVQLKREGIHRLADGRWQVTWEKDRPRLNEHYRLCWTW